MQTAHDASEMVVHTSSPPFQGVMALVGMVVVWTTTASLETASTVGQSGRCWGTEVIISISQL